jgi:osmotically inducible protein OsmC
MAELKRHAEAVWRGDLKSGEGKMSSESGVLQSVGYSFSTRFENEPGTNPEELIAAAHAGCYSMAFAATLAAKGYKPEAIETRATCTLASQAEGGFKIAKMQLKVRARVPDIDQATLRQIAAEADKGCPVSNALRGGLEIEHEVTLA